MPNGFGRGLSFRRGVGFGFRGSSPPWPYVGRGRGGLPRCGYFLSGTADIPAAPPYQQPSYPFYAAPPTPGIPPYAPQMTKEQELDVLETQAQAMREQLKQIETSIHELEGESKL